MDYFTQLLYTLIGFKIVLLLVASGSALLPVIKHLRTARRGTSSGKSTPVARSRPQPLATNTSPEGDPSRDVAPISEAAAVTINPVDGTQQPQRPTSHLCHGLGKVVYGKVIRLVSMVLFIGYPSISVKVLQLFHCVTIDNVSYLIADMRLQCYTPQWSMYAIYGVVMVVLYVVGFPFTIFCVLYRNRHTLFGPDSGPTMRLYGFLYDAYGPTACYWEVEELIRKLLLTAVAVLLDTGNPLQVRRAELRYCSAGDCNHITSGH